MEVESSASETEAPPAWELVFRFSGGRLCLAFTATVGERWRRSFERLREPDDLARWVVEAGLVPVAPDVDAEALAAARDLREAIYRSVTRAMTGQPAAAADRRLLNQWSRGADLAPQMDEAGVRRSWSGPHPSDACLVTVARDAIDLLTGRELSRVRECGAADCALLFVDRSRPGKRRWCSDGACGSRARSARYRQQHRQPAQQTQPARQSG